MCKHDCLVIGQIYLVNVIGGTCSQCGSVHNIESSPAIYSGHVEHGGLTKALFEFAVTYLCPGCGMSQAATMEPCNGRSNYYEIETSIPVENWPIKKEAIT